MMNRIHALVCPDPACGRLQGMPAASPWNSKMIVLPQQLHCKNARGAGAEIGGAAAAG
jgi:hypothetical protein